MKTSWNDGIIAKFIACISLSISILTAILYFWPIAGEIADMVRDKELFPAIGFIVFALLGIIAPIGVFFFTLFIFAVGVTKIENCVFARNRKFEQIAKFIIEVRK